MADTPLAQDSYANDLCGLAIKEINLKSQARVNLNAQCEEVAALISPADRGSFFYGSIPIPYSKKTDQQVDATGMMALRRFTAIADSLLTPKNMLWHGLGNSDLKKDRASQLWFENTKQKLFKLRYDVTSGFVGHNRTIFKSLGAYGNGSLYIDGYFDIYKRKKALRYLSIPFGDIYTTRNHQGVADGFIRILRFTAKQANDVPFWKGNLPELVQNSLEQGLQRKFVFLHRVCPNYDYDPVRIDYKGMAYSSYYVCLDTRTLMPSPTTGLAMGGFRSLPIASPRYQQALTEDDGRSIAMDVLPALKTLNAEKKDFLTQGHRAAVPTYLLADDGLMNLNAAPGAQNVGGFSADGKPLVGILPTGEIQITETMMAEEKGLINDAFLVSLFQIMTEKNGMTATEVIERINEKGILIAPELGAMEGEYLGPMIARELDVMSEMKLLDPLPPALKEAQGEYSINYTSPLAKAARAQESAGFMRSVESTKEIVNITGDVSLMDPYDFDTATPEIADINGTPPTWMRDKNAIAQIRQGRAQQQQKQDAIQAAPAAAAMMKAQAVSAKAGVAPAGRNLAPGPSQSQPGIPTPQGQ